MNQIVKYLICFVLGGLICFLLLHYFSHDTNNIDLLKRNQEAEQKIELLELRFNKQRYLIDSLSQLVTVYNTSLLKEKSNIEIVKQKHEALRNNLLMLNTDESILYMSKRLSQKGNNR